MKWKSEAEKYKMKMEDRSEMMLDLTSHKRAINNYCKVLSSIAKWSGLLSRDMTVSAIETLFWDNSITEAEKQVQAHVIVFYDLDWEAL